MPCSRSLGGVSQHALQVSRPTPKGEVEGDLARGVPVLGGGGEVPAPGGCVGCGDPPVTATAAGGTHPTGMHSCYTIKFDQKEKAQLYK